MNADGTFAAAEARPNFPWPVTHTVSRNNSKLWIVDRPVPINYDIPMDWHHMMPWNAIRGAWSALATSDQWGAIEIWLELLSVEAWETRLAEMRASNMGTVHANDVTEKLCWAKWNLVEGPNNTNREDDPGGEGFDKFATIKFSNNVRSRSQILHLIYDKVRLWTVDKNDVSDTEAKLLIDWFKSLKSYKSSPIAMFEPAAWKIGTVSGKYDSFGNASRHPKWVKA